MIVTDRPYEAFVSLVRSLVSGSNMPPGLRAGSAVIDPSASVDPTAAIGPGCIIGANSVIGIGVQLVANVVVYPDSRIGRETILHGNVTICAGSVIGERCIIHAGAVIGSDGFGYVENTDKSFTKIQIGRAHV